jgi:outer membrane immunogenic protein
MKRFAGFALAATLFGPMIGLQPAEAADFGNNALRGSIQDPPAASLWDGFYFGGTGGYGAANMAPSNTAQNMVSKLLYGTEFQSASPSASSFVNLKKITTEAGSYGVFAGYNTTWDDVVLGVEADYTRTNLKANSSFNVPGIIFPSTVLTSPQQFASFTENGADRTVITDIVTVRGRVGYAMGNFMPFATLGLAVAHGIRNTSVNVTTSYALVAGGTPTPGLGGTFTAAQGNQDRFAAGLAMGVGAEYAITANFFLRAEYEFLKFPSFGGTNIDLSIARAGAGVKF